MAVTRRNDLGLSDAEIDALVAKIEKGEICLSKVSTAIKARYWCKQIESYRKQVRRLEEELAYSKKAMDQLESEIMQQARIIDSLTGIQTVVEESNG